MQQSTPPSAPRAKKRSTSPSSRSAKEPATGSSAKASSTVPAGFHGSPGEPDFRIDRSSFPADDSAPASLTATPPSTSKNSIRPTPRDPLSLLAAASPTPAFISGEQGPSPFVPSSPRKSSADEGRRFNAGQARRLLENKLQVRIPRSTFYRWLLNGTLPADKLVSKYLIKHENLQRFAEQSAW